MFRNQYDTDVTVWSPQGRLHQVEYAMEVVNQVRMFMVLKRNEGCAAVKLRMCMLGEDVVGQFTLYRCLRQTTPYDYL